MVEALECLGVPTPRLNPDLKGQAKAEREFLQEFGTGQMHHAWLISGPRGVGKATFAYRVARYVLAKKTLIQEDPAQTLELAYNSHTENADASDVTMCLEQQHPVFRRVASGTHADFLSIERGVDERTKVVRKEIIVQDVRAIRSFLNKTPVEAGWRVVLIDAADEMTTSAENALLKVLEEPPRRALLLLVSHNRNSLLATSRSRCRKLCLKPLDMSILTTIIRGYAPKINDEDLKILLALSNGSLGLALRLLEHDGLKIYRSTNTLLSNLIDLNILDLYNLSDKITKDNNHESFLIFRLILNYWLTETVKSKAVHGARYELDITKWIDIREEVNYLFNKTESVNLDPKQVVLNVFFAIAAVEQDDFRGIQ